MKSLEDSILDSMDGDDKALLSYLPYILQDIWSIGTDPQAAIELIIGNFHRTPHLTVLDLGCGKGAVSIYMAEAFGCSCHGIDGIPAFIEFARNKAKAFGVEGQCTFEVGDIRTRLPALPSFDVVILGAIGPVFGNYKETVEKIELHLNLGGGIIVDDAYTPDEKNKILSDIDAAGMAIAEESIFSSKKVQRINAGMYQYIKRRCDELIINHPEKRQLFEQFLRSQEKENQVLEDEVISSMILMQRK